MLFCDCLNFVGQIDESASVENSNGFQNNASAAVSDVSFFEALEFLKSATGPVKARVAIQHEALVQQQKVDKWTFQQQKVVMNVKFCLNCDSFVYATVDGMNEEMMWLNPSLIRDQAQLQTMQTCDKYSMPFKIILKPIDGIVSCPLMSISDDTRLKSLYGKLQDFIETDAAQTQAVIARLTMEMNTRRQRAQKDFERIATLIESTKTLSTDNIELTPPVTPESINEKSVDNQLQLPQPMKMNIKGSDKHSNAISQQQQQVRPIEFDDGVFEFEGMMQHDDGQNEPDRSHQASEDEDGSDNEQRVDKRNNRGRSGSINIARSAPISMPQFIHHAIHEIDSDEKPTTDQQMDIASSIQMLARSIHTDSIFGELPARPVLRYNTEF